MENCAKKVYSSQMTFSTPLILKSCQNSTINRKRYIVETNCSIAKLAEPIACNETAEDAD